MLEQKFLKVTNEEKFKPLKDLFNELKGVEYEALAAFVVDFLAVINCEMIKLQGLGRNFLSVSFQYLYNILTKKIYKIKRSEYLLL